MTAKYRLQKIFREVFDDPTLELSDDLSTGTYEDWDSVATVQLVLATESEFGCRFTTDEVASIQSAADILSLIEKQPS